MGKSYVFGIGNAQATRCYNTRFAIGDGDEYFMVDAGGGNGIPCILEDMDADLRHIHSIFVTHEHTDHILGTVWMVCMVAAAMKKGKYKGELQIYRHQGPVDTISIICRLTIQGRFYKMIESRIFPVPVEDGETVHILDHDVTFLDILSTKVRQFGFTTILKNGCRLTCAGDEPHNAECHPYVEGSDWLPHEASCLYRDREIFEPYEKHYNTVKEACELAEDLSIPDLVLWHTEDKHLTEHKALYTAKGRKYYCGNLLVPDGGGILPLQRSCIRGITESRHGKRKHHVFISPWCFLCLISARIAENSFFQFRITINAGNDTDKRTDRSSPENAELYREPLARVHYSGRIIRGLPFFSLIFCQAIQMVQTAMDHHDLSVVGPTLDPENPRI